jgi:hypothetical protein
MKHEQKSSSQKSFRIGGYKIMFPKAHLHQETMRYLGFWRWGPLSLIALTQAHDVFGAAPWAGVGTNPADQEWGSHPKPQIYGKIDLIGLINLILAHDVNIAFLRTNLS